MSNKASKKHLRPASPSPFDTKKKRRRQEEENPLPPSQEDMPLDVPFTVVNGMRHLSPYWTYFKTNTKGRWIGKKLYEAFRDEFVANSENYSKVAIKMGRFIINGNQCTDPNYILRNNDSICHITHRHEPPVLDIPIKYIFENEDLLVVNKPPSMTVHPCAQYKIHSVMGILWTQHKLNGLRMIHRLDRATSGVLILAKNYKTDIEFKTAMQNCGLKKEYVCKVEGVFPDGEINCEQPMGHIYRAIGLQCVRPDGKSAKSTFRRLWTDGKNSVVSALIETGRTHQIRVHLQYLGYPILNDYIYNSFVWGPNKGRGADFGKPLETLFEDLKKVHDVSHWFDEKNPDYLSKMEKFATEELAPENLDDFGVNGITNRPEFDPICLRCNAVRKNPELDYMSMFLHCRKYESEKYTFEAPIPDWAIEQKKEKEQVRTTS